MSDTHVVHVRPEGELVGGNLGGLSVPGRTVRVDVVDSIARLTDYLARGIDLVVTEYTLPGRETGLDVLSRIRQFDAELPVILCTGDPDGEVASAATRLGVTEYVPRSGDGAVTLVDRVRDLLARDTYTDGGAAAVRRYADPISDVINDAVVTIDADGQIVYANEATVALTGYDRNRLVGGSFTRVVPEEHRTSQLDAIREYAATDDRSLEREYLDTTILDAEGQKIPVSVSFSEEHIDGERYLTGVLRDVTDREHRERELARANTRLDLALDSIDGGVFVWETGENEIHWDAQTASLFGFDATERTVTPETYLSFVDDRDHDRINTAVSAAQSGSDDFAIEYRIEREDGTRRWLATDAETIRGADGSVERMVGITRDVTDRRETAAELRESQSALEQLYEITADTDRDFAAKRDAILDLGRDRLNLPVGFLTEIEDGSLEIVASVGDETLEGHTAPLEGEYCAETVDVGLAATTNAPTDSWAAEPYETYGIACYIGGEIVVEGETHGTICFADEAARSREFSEFERTFVELATLWLGYEQERRNREHELERYETIIETVEDGVYALDHEGRFTFANDALAELTGYDRADLLGRHVGLLKDDETVTRGEDILGGLLSSGERETTLEFDLHRADGTTVPCEDRLTVLPMDDGAFAGTAGVFRDISQHKKRERELTGLLETTRALMAAPTKEDVAKIVVRAARNSLGFELNALRLYDPESGYLEPTVVTDETRELLGERPLYEPGEGFPGRVYETGEPTVYDDTELPETDFGPVAEAFCLPLGEHGTLTLSSCDLDSFDELDRQIAAILATNARAALDRAEREQELERYETVMETVQHMVYVLDGDGRFTHVTRPFAERLGYDRDELIGTDARRVVASEEDIETVHEGIRRLVDDDGPTNVELELGMTTDDGGTFPAAVDVSLLPADTYEGTVGVVRDVTELTATRAELADERDRFTYLFDNLPDAVVETDMIDGEPVVRSTNDAFEDLFGYPGDCIEGDSLNEHVLPADLSADEVALDERTAAGEQVQAEVRRETSMGDRYFLFRGVPYEVGGDATRVFGIYTDITEQRHRERQLQVLTRVLRHNIRNELTVIIGQADQLRLELDDDHHGSMVDTILETAQDVATMSEKSQQIEQIIGHSVGDHSVDAAAIVRRVAEQYRRTYPTAEITVDAPRSLSVRADSQLEAAVENLVENAIEHNDTATPRVEITVGAGADTATVTVTDDGPGIPATERAVISGDDDITQLTHGSGIGLWLVRWIVESCGGDITFADAPDGSEVALELDIAD